MVINIKSKQKKRLNILLKMLSKLCYKQDNCVDCPAYDDCSRSKFGDMENKEVIKWVNDGKKYYE